MTAVPDSAYVELERLFSRIHAFRGAAGILRWDAAVIMPPGGAESRGEQMEALETECHALLTAARTGHLLDRAERQADGLDEWQRANLREMRRQWLLANALPTSLVAQLAKLQGAAELLWKEAREAADFSLLRPHFEALLPLVRRRAEILGQALQVGPYDALLQEFDPGRRAREVDEHFRKLGAELPRLVDAAIDIQADRPILPAGRAPVSRQRRLAHVIMQVLGFPFDRGRLDESAHPFTEGVPGDVRITTRFNPADPLTGLMAVLHETGHALYELDLPPAWRTQPVGRDCGMTVHESQSLFMEMIIGRSRPFMDYASPVLKRVLRVDGPDWAPGNLYRLATRVERTLIRVDADEVTYPAHILLRYELEQALLDGTLALPDLPEAWAAGMERHLGVRPANDREGCLQDIHWPMGLFGYFPSYALGAMMAAQLYAALLREEPAIHEDWRRGDFATTRAWLARNVHGHGMRLTPDEILGGATGSALRPEPYLDYLRAKFLSD